MNADERDLAASADQALTGQEARRNFIKKSGGMAIAAPAVVLLLAAGSKPAVAKNHYSTPKAYEPPKKNLLDP